MRHSDEGRFKRTDEESHEDRERREIPHPAQAGIWNDDLVGFIASHTKISYFSFELSTLLSS
jgi:hypothetical protein